MPFYLRKPPVCHRHLSAQQVVVQFPCGKLFLCSKLQLLSELGRLSRNVRRPSSVSKALSSQKCFRSCEKVTSCWVVPPDTKCREENSFPCENTGCKLLSDNKLLLRTTVGIVSLASENQKMKGDSK